MAPSEASPRFNLAMCYQQMGRHREAIDSFTACLRSDPNHLQALTAFAHFLLTLGRAAEATPLLRRAFELHPNSVGGLLQLGQAQIEEGEFQGAEASFKDAIEMAPQDGSGYELLGTVYKHMGRFDEAMLSFQSALERRPKRVGLYLDVVSCRRMAESDRLLAQRIEDSLLQADLIPEGRIRLHFAAGKLFDDLGDYQSAMSHFDEAHRCALAQSAAQGTSFDRELSRKRFDSIIERFPRSRLEKPETFGERPRCPIFVFGMVRSGTTLVEQILTRHPEVASGGELAFWPQNWQRVGAGPVEQDRSIAARYMDLLESMSPKKRYMTDKMPGNYIALGSISSLFPDAKFIYCKRSPIDNCVSIFTTPFGTSHNWIHDRDDIVSYYRDHERLMTHWQDVLPPGTIQEVCYEDLVDHPQESARKLVDYVGLEWDNACLSPEKNQRPVRTPSQWQVRQPIYSSSVGRWRNYEPWLGSLRHLLQEGDL